VTTEIETQRRGTRVTYPEQLPYPYLEYHTPVHGDRPFAIVHLDHTLLDIELVAQASGRNLGRPWATFLMDAFSRRLLAVYITFDPPSYRSCMMSIRIYVKRGLVEASLADMAADIVSDEQQVALTSVDRSQLNSLLRLESEAAPPETNAGEGKPTRTQRTSTRPGTRKAKRDPVGESSPQT
jgi:transposase InsO family protein